MTPAPAPLPVAPAVPEVKPIVIFIYDSAPLARAIRQAYVDNPSVYWVESKWLPDGTQRLGVWKRGTL